MSRTGIEPVSSRFHFLSTDFSLALSQLSYRDLMLSIEVVLHINNITEFTLVVFR